MQVFDGVTLQPPSISIFPVSKIPSPSRQHHFCRVVPFPNSNPDSTPCEIRLAVSQYLPKSESDIYRESAVFLYRFPLVDVEDPRFLPFCQLVGHHVGMIFGLGCLPVFGTEEIRVISSDHRSHICVWSDSGDFLCDLGGHRSTETRRHNITRKIVCEQDGSGVFFGAGGIGGGRSSSGMFEISRYDVRAEEKTASYRGHLDAVYGLAQFAERNAFFSCGNDKTVRLWSKTESGCVESVRSMSQGCSCCFHNGLLFVGLKQSLIECRDPRRLDKLLKEVSVGGGYVWEIDGVGGTDAVVAVSSRTEYNVALWNLRKKTCLSGSCVDWCYGCCSIGEASENGVAEVVPTVPPTRPTASAFPSSRIDDTLRGNGTEILRMQEELRADGLSSRTRKFLRLMDSQNVSSLDLSERYRRRGCLDFREHILSSSDFELARGTGDGRFAFRDIWFGHDRGDRVSFVPFDEEEEGGEVASQVETVVIDLFNDSSLVELVLDESTVSRDDILDLQEDWDGFFRAEPVYDTRKLIEACKDTMLRKVRLVLSRIYEFFGGKVTEEVVSRYNESHRGSQAGSECLLGSMKGFGLGRHRSLCFKFVCDRLGIPCRLLRGWRTCSVDGLTQYEPKRPDAWCVVDLCDRFHFVDLVNSGCLIDEFSPVLCESSRKMVEETPLSIDLVQFRIDYPRLSKDLLGHGGFGQAFAVEFGGEFLAVKEANLTQRIAEEGPAATARVRRELNLMSSFNHPNIVPTCGSFEFVRRSSVLSRRHRRGTRKVHGVSGTDETIVGIVMPLYDRNAKVLREIFREADSQIALRETLFLLLSVASGLRYLHSLSILHLDVKPDNVLVNVDEEKFTLSEIRICDFGGSRPHCTLMSLSALPVSLGFCSPELKQAADGDDTIVLDESSDVWSFGALMRFYNCYFGTFRQLYELCDRCLSDDRVLRPNLIEVMSILRSHLLFVDAKRCRSEEDVM